MRWLDRLGFWRRQGEVKQSATTRLVVLGLGDTVFPSTNFEGVAREGFQRSITVYALVMIRAQAAARVPWVLMKVPKVRGARIKKLMTMDTALKAWGTRHPQARRAVETSEITNHELLTLLERPNPFQGQGQFLESHFAYRLLAGNAYIETAGPKTGPPRELWAIRPDRMRVVPHPIERVSGYVYEHNGQQQLFPRAAILHQAMFNPLDDFYGQSPLQAAMRVLATDNEAVKWNYALMKNSGTPRSVLLYQGTLGPQQYQRWQATIEQEFSGFENAGRPILLESGGPSLLDWKQVALTPNELDWLAGRKEYRRELCATYHVAPELLGDGEAKVFATAREARKALYDEAALPDVELLRDELNNWLVPRYGDNLRLEVDRDQIEPLQEELEKLWDRLERSTDLTINEKRTAKGYDEIEGGDVVLISMALTPLDQVLNPPEPTPVVEDEDVTPEPAPAPATEDDETEALTGIRTIFEQMRALPAATNAPPEPVPGRELFEGLRRT